MSKLPILLVIDLNTLIDSSPRAWPDYARAGSCYLPQVVYEELEFLSGRAPEPKLETAAREFLRFFPNSGWEVTNTSAVHPTLIPPPGKNLSKQARQSLAVAECAYGLSQAHPGELVVLVSNTQQLLKVLPGLGSPNLCGITAAALLQWARTEQQPPAVAQQMQTMPRGGTQPRTSTPAASRRESPAPKATSSTPMTGPASATRTTSSTKRKSGGGGLSGLIGGLLGLLVLAIAGGFVWRAVQPASFDKLWQQLGLPALPGQQPAQKPKPVKK